MPPVGFEPKILAGERPETYALDRAATGSGERHKVTTRKINELRHTLSLFGKYY
jgi:hypothetical protein